MNNERKKERERVKKMEKKNLNIFISINVQIFQANFLKIKKRFITNV